MCPMVTGLRCPCSVNKAPYPAAPTELVLFNQPNCNQHHTPTPSFSDELSDNFRTGFYLIPLSRTKLFFSPGHLFFQSLPHRCVNQPQFTPGFTAIALETPHKSARLVQ